MKKYVIACASTLVIIGAGYYAWSLSHSAKSAESRIELGEASGRIALYRPVHETAPSMEVCQGSNCKTVINQSFLASEKPEPFYMDLGDTQAPVSILYKENPDVQPTLIPLPKPEVMKEGFYDDNHPDLVYSGAWVIQNREGPSEDRVHTSIDENASVSFSFSGTALEIGFVRYDDRNSATLCMNDSCRVIDLYSPALEWGTSYLWTGLADGTHRATLSFKNGKAFDVDWVHVRGKKDVLTASSITPWQDHMTLSKGWRYDENTGLLESPRRPAYLGFEAEGNNVSIQFESNLDAGETEICINDICQTHDLRAPAPTQHSLSWPLEKGINSIRITKGKARFITIASITVD